MRYISTRGTAPALDFEGVTLAGLASDGGLYVPEAWPQFAPGDLKAMAGLDYPALAARIMAPYTGPSIPEDDLAALVADAYSDFDDDAVAPVRQLGNNEWLLELHHGPTLAFKDLALQVLGRLFDYFLERRGERLTIVGATSGDTGSAAIEACRDRASVEIFMLHPEGRVTEVQRRQMTTVRAPNVHNIAIEGTFDDCQAIVKALFADQDFRGEIKLSAVNSINWARICAQIVYYFSAALAVGGPGVAVSFAVPTGNFGDVYAGYAAARMGLPIAHLIVATNTNDILDRALGTGAYELGEVQPTMSPSMDIQVSSNFERLLFDLYERQPEPVAALMEELAASGGFRIAEAPLAEAAKLFTSGRVDEARCAEAMLQHYREHGTLVDPHTAVGIAAGRARRADTAVPLVFLSTAHAAKFPDAVERSCGVAAEVPARLADVLAREECYDKLGCDAAAVKAYIREHAGR